MKLLTALFICLLSSSTDEGRILDVVVRDVKMGGALSSACCIQQGPAPSNRLVVSLSARTVETILLNTR